MGETATSQNVKSILGFLTHVRGLWPLPWSQFEPSGMAFPILLEWLDVRKPQFGEALDPWLSCCLTQQQWEAARQLEIRPLVFVHGPAGSGKSYMLARLVGLWLSLGRTVLLTSPCPGALAELQALVPVGPPADSANLARCVAQLEEARAARLAQEPALAEAARRVAEGKGRHDWIPGSIRDGPMPLSVAEVEELYGSTAGPELDSKLRGSLPDPNRLMSVQELDRLKELEVLFRDYEDELFWQNTHHSQEDLEALRAAAEGLADLIQDAPDWWLECAWAVRKGTEEGHSWRELSLELDRLQRDRDRLLQGVAGRRIDLPEGSRSDQFAICQELLSHVASKGAVGWVAFKPRWKRFLEQTKIDGERPSRADDFRLLADRLEAERIDETIQEMTAEEISRLTGRPTEPQDCTAELHRAVHDLPPRFEQFEQRAGAAGLRWEKAMSQTTRAKRPPGGELKLLRAGLAKWLLPVIGRRVEFVELAELRKREQSHLGWLPATKKVGMDQESTTDPRQLRAGLRAAVVSRDVEGYSQLLGRLMELTGLRSGSERYNQLLERLASAAPDWATALAERKPPHDASLPPGDPAEAWAYLQALQRLKAAGAESPETAEIRRLRQQLAGQRPTRGTLQVRSLEEVSASSEPFDLVVVDHAGACALPGLPLVGRGRRVLVLGDIQHPGPPPPASPEQVVQAARAHSLDDRYDAFRSVLELARQTATLAENLGLAPEVAELLNRLGASVPVTPGGIPSDLPPLVVHRVEGRREEQEAAALALAILRRPESSGLSVGVVCLGGPLAARRTASHLEEELTDEERLRWACVSSEEAQGRRWDVVLVCLGDRPEDGRLPLRQNPQYRR
ncbi:MAG: AAA family ATPase, partial [Candidatus Eremiobacterota bacterium]